MKKITLLLAVLSCASSVLLLSTQTYAQAASCKQLNNSLQSLNRNGDFGNLSKNTNSEKKIQTFLRSAESQFVRNGCQKTLNSGGKLTRECRSLAQSIIKGRKDRSTLQARIETGEAVSQQREVTLQQIARFGCRSGSSASVTQDERPAQKSPFADFLNRLLGGNNIRESDTGFFDQSTLRSVCVRACDGYYWPISFSTVQDYLQLDAETCRAQAGEAEAELYYYSNPGEDADAMVNLRGQPYTAHPNAFLYRQEFNAQCSAKPKLNIGTIQLTKSADGGMSRAQIVFDGLTLPFPMRDPRRKLSLTVAEVEYVPLPRPRPVREGEETTSTSPNLSQATRGSVTDARVITSGNRTVRIVGPDTPYVQAAAKGS